jgi:hypothetical protein
LGSCDFVGTGVRSNENRIVGAAKSRSVVFVTACFQRLVLLSQIKALRTNWGSNLAGLFL